MMSERKHQAIERRMERRHAEIDEEMHALDEEGNQFWTNRHRHEMERHFQEWEEEQEHRREEEGDDFDEEAYQFERRHMERRHQLEESRMALQEEFDQLFRELGEEELSPMMSERKHQAIERRMERRFDALEDEIRELEEEMQRYWEERHAGEPHDGGGWDEEHADGPVGDGRSSQRRWADDEAPHGPDGDDGARHTDGPMDSDGDDKMDLWPIGINSVRLNVIDTNDLEVFVEVEIANSEPIAGWKIQINFDYDVLAFAGVEKGDFIANHFMPPHLENDNGVEIGGAQLGRGESNDGDGILATVRFNVIGDLPTEISASALHLEGATSEPNLATGPVLVGD